MSDRTFARRKTATSTFSQPSLVSSTTPTLANPTRGFGLTNNNVIQKATDVSKEQQEVQSADEGSLEQLTIQEKPLGHDISRISFRRPQAKLTVGEPGDQYEQEADWMANRVMSMSDNAPQVQRLEEDENPVQMSSLAQSITPVVQRQADEQIQMKPGETQASGDVDKPPNTLIPLSSDPADQNKHRASDAIVLDFRAAAKEVQDNTGIDLTKSPGDTVRNMAGRTSKPGADNFSWHKTGRAIDINQGHKWVITQDPAPDSMQFRIYLEKKGSKESNHTHTFSNKTPPNFHVNPFGKNIYKKTFIDVTAILIKYGFSRISAHDGWEKTQTKQEWWHYEKRDGKKMYQALRDIYSEQQIITEYSKLVTNEKSLLRLHREGFPPDTLQKIAPKMNVKQIIEREMSKK